MWDLNESAPASPAFITFFKDAHYMSYVYEILFLIAKGFPIPPSWNSNSSSPRVCVRVKAERGDAHGDRQHQARSRKPWTTSTPARKARASPPSWRNASPTSSSVTPSSLCPGAHLILLRAVQPVRPGPLSGRREAPDGVPDAGAAASAGTLLFVCHLVGKPADKQLDGMHTFVP